MQQPRPVEAPSRLKAATPTLILCAVGVLIPNLLSVAALALGIGMPPRTTAIMAYAALALVAKRAPLWLTVPALLGLAAYDAVATIALLFNLAPGEIGTALHLSRELKLAQSPFYVGIAAAALLAMSAHIGLLARFRTRMRDGSAVALAALAALVATADFLTNTSVHYHFGTLYGQGKPMESAAAGSGFRASVLKGDDHVLLVMVEALGQFADPAYRALLEQPFESPAVRARYRVTTGTTTYFGSTTAAEMRELCDTRESYEVLLGGRRLSCLADALAARGVDTLAMHNFTGAFFDRTQWYPRIGFQRSLFMDDLLPGAPRLCGGPFRGPCDADLIPRIRDRLKTAGGRTFTYWMTLSTHVPIGLREGTPRLSCENGGGPMRHAEVCGMSELWIDLMQGLAELTAEIPATEILIVGDHAPPLWSKAGRNLFAPGQVPWIRLSPKPEAHARVRG